MYFIDITTSWWHLQHVVAWRQTYTFIKHARILNKDIPFARSSEHFTNITTMWREHRWRDIFPHDTFCWFVDSYLMQQIFHVMKKEKKSVGHILPVTSPTFGSLNSSLWGIFFCIGHLVVRHVSRREGGWHTQSGIITSPCHTYHITPCRKQNIYHLPPGNHKKLSLKRKLWRMLTQLIGTFYTCIYIHSTRQSLYMYVLLLWHNMIMVRKECRTFLA